MTIILAFLISVQLLLTITKENNIINNLNENNKSLFTRFYTKNNKKIFEISESDFPILSNIIYYFDHVMKCGLAFFLGGLISERKFINVGKI